MAIHKLSATRIAKLTKNGAYGDGNNLWLQIRNNGASKLWIFRWKDRVTKRDRVISIGPLRFIGVDEARATAANYCRMLWEHKDPKKERDNRILDQQIKEGKARTVRQVIEEYYDSKVAHRALNTRRGARRYLNMVNRAIGDMPIMHVDRHVWFNKLNFVELWVSKNPTAMNVLSQLKQVFELAIEQGYYTDLNPATWDRVKASLPKAREVHRTKHHDALPYKQIGRFMEKLRAYRYRGFLKRYESRPPITLLLELMILSGCRPGEARQAQWKEFDFETMIWTVPPEHLKMGRVHGQAKQVPITKPMLAVLEEAKKIAYPKIQSPTHSPGSKKERPKIFPRARHTPDQSPDAWVFPNSTNNPYAEALIARFVRVTMKQARARPHGFRSTLRDWMRAETTFDDVLWQIQADHRGDKLNRTYGHHNLLDQRRRMMELWGEYCSKPAPEPKAGEVFKLTDKKRRPG
jgi:integrase